MPILKYIVITATFAASMAGKGTPISGGKEVFESSVYISGTDTLIICPEWYATQFPAAFDTLKPFILIDIKP